MPLILPAKNFDLLVLHIPVLSLILPNQGQNTILGLNIVECQV